VVQVFQIIEEMQVSILYFQVLQLQVVQAVAGAAHQQPQVEMGAQVGVVLK